MINMIIWCFLFDQICQIQLEVSCLGSWFTILTGFPLGKFFQTQPICLTMNSWLPRISKAMRVTVKRAMVALRCLISFHHHHHQSHKNPMEPGRVLWFPTATMRSFVYSFRICLADIGRFVSNFRFPWIVCESSVYVQHRQLSFELSHPEKPISSAMEKTHLFFVEAPISYWKHGEFSFRDRKKWPSGFLRWRRGLHGNSPWDSGALWRRVSLYISHDSWGNKNSWKKDMST